MSRTLRLVIPQWQGGMNPNYVFGSFLLSCIAPANQKDETITISVDTDFDANSRQVDGIDCGEALLGQQREIRRVLEEKQPDKLIVFGGDCAVNQVPFDYLSKKYQEKIGILWLDAHPDVANTKTSSHLHEMVLGNLLGLGSNSEITKVENPYSPKKVFLAGLIEEDLRPMDQICKDLNLCIASPEQLAKSSDSVLNWIEKNDIEYVAVHWDLDVLSPKDCRSIYPAEPYLDVKDFPAAVGRMTLNQVSNLLADVSKKAEIVGLGMTEHLPWDAINIRKTLSQIAIFQ